MLRTMSFTFYAEEYLDIHFVMDFVMIMPEQPLRNMGEDSHIRIFQIVKCLLLHTYVFRRLEHLILDAAYDIQNNLTPSFLRL
jgi:hypothetical protein